MSESLYSIRPWLGDVHLSKIYLGNNHLIAAYVGDKLVYGNTDNTGETGLPFNIYWQARNYILYRPRNKQKFQLEIFDYENNDWRWRTLDSYVDSIIYDDNSTQAGFIYNIYGDPLPSMIPPDAGILIFKTDKNDEDNSPQFTFNFKKSVYEIQKCDNAATHVAFTAELFSVDNNGEAYTEDYFEREIEFGTSAGHLDETSDDIEWVCNKYSVTDPPTGYPTHVILTGDFSLNFYSLNNGEISINDNRELYVKITIGAAYYNDYFTRIYFGVLYFDGMNMGMSMEGNVYNSNNDLQIRLETYEGQWCNVFYDMFHIYYFTSLDYYGGYANLNLNGIQFYSTKYPSSTISGGYMWRKTIFIVRDKSSKQWMKYDPNFTIVSTTKPSSGDGWISFTQDNLYHHIPEQYDRCIITFLIVYDNWENADKRFKTFMSTEINSGDNDTLNDTCG